MGRRIRWLGLVLILCFTLVLLQLVNVQFRKAAALAHDPNNPRNQVDKYDNQRGLILAADGTVLAKSVKSPNGPWQYERVYPGGSAASLYSSVVGYDSLEYGTSGAEYEYNGYLSTHSQPAQSLSQLLSPPPKTTDNVTLTVQPYLQEEAQLAVSQIAGANKDAAVVALNPQTGAVEAMYSNPSYDPTRWPIPTSQPKRWPTTPTANRTRSSSSRSRRWPRRTSSSPARPPRWSRALPCTTSSRRSPASTTPTTRRTLV